MGRRDGDGAVWVTGFNREIDVVWEVFPYPVGKETDCLLRCLPWCKTEVELDQAGRRDCITVSLTCVTRLDAAHLYRWQETVCCSDVVAFVDEKIFDPCGGLDLIGGDGELCIVGEHLIGDFSDSLIVAINRQPVLVIVQTCEKFTGFVCSIWCDTSVESTM